MPRQFWIGRDRLRARSVLITKVHDEAAGLGGQHDQTRGAGKTREIADVRKMSDDKRIEAKFRDQAVYNPNSRRNGWTAMVSVSEASDRECVGP